MKNGLVDINKKVLKTFAINMTSKDNISSIRGTGATTKILEDGSYQITPNEYWGNIVCNLNNLKDIGDVFYLIFRGKMTDIVETMGKNWCAVYTYKDMENLGAMSIIEQDALPYKKGDFAVHAIVRKQGNQSDINTITVGCMVGKGNTSIFNDECVTLIDITELYAMGLQKLSDIQSFFGTDEYFDVLPNKYIAQTAQTAEIAQTAQTAQTAEIAQTAQTAEIAQTAQTAEIAQIAQKKIYVEYDEWRTENGPFTPNADGSYTYQPSLNYGAVMIKPLTPLEIGKKYLVIWNKQGLDGYPEDNYTQGAFLSNSRWVYGKLVTLKVSDKYYGYSILTPNSNITDLDKCYITASYGSYQTNKYTFRPVGVYELDLDAEITDDNVIKIIEGGIEIYTALDDHEKRLSSIESLSSQGSWKGKNVLVIGDSITAANKWQSMLNIKLGMIVSTHAKGGVGMIAMVDGDKGLGGDYDNTTNASGTLRPLSTEDVKDKDLIIFLGGYNNRSLLVGSCGDVYPTNNTFSGQLQYCINRIYEMLAETNNLACKVMVGTLHCFGKYPYVDADGYEEYPVGSGQTVRTLCEKIIEVAHNNNIAVCDLYNESGINKFTWKVFGSSPESYIENPSNTSVPYPHNGDQLHCSNLGYERIGECMVGAIIKSFGN